jgi:hypothetical protein
MHRRHSLLDQRFKPRLVRRREPPRRRRQELAFELGRLALGRQTPHRDFGIDLSRNLRRQQLVFENSVRLRHKLAAAPISSAIYKMTSRYSKPRQQINVPPLERRSYARS